MNVTRRGFLGSMLGALAAGSAVIPKVAPRKVTEFRDTGFRIAHVAVWSVALKDWELRALADGVSPTSIRSDSRGLLTYEPRMAGADGVPRMWTFVHTSRRSRPNWRRGASRPGCPPGGTVLDPFAGAGTTLLVAERLGRDSGSS